MVAAVNGTPVVVDALPTVLESGINWICAECRTANHYSSHYLKKPCVIVTECAHDGCRARNLVRAGL